MKYRNYQVYQTLERMVRAAGVDVIYQEVSDDRIDGEIWARSDIGGRMIMMPDSDDAFPEEDTACLILGHEMGHILSELDSPDDPATRRLNEATCDQIGVYLYRLAVLMSEKEMEDQLRSGASN